MIFFDNIMVVALQSDWLLWRKLLPVYTFFDRFVLQPKLAHKSRWLEDWSRVLKAA
jgi:hypothetical protein